VERDSRGKELEEANVTETDSRTGTGIHMINEGNN